MRPLNRNELSRLVIKGYKSIAACDLQLGPLNLLVGSNGAGKSNFIEFFEMIRQMLDGNLQLYTGRQGGPDAVLHFGRKQTGTLETRLYFGNSGYRCTLEPTQDNRLMFSDEAFYREQGGSLTLGGGHFETRASEAAGTSTDRRVFAAMRQWRAYHFHDTSDTSYIKQRHAINDNAYIRPDARNLAAYLYLLKQTYPDHYRKILNTIRLAAPFFNDFHLRPRPDNEDVIELEWTEKGEDVPFKAHHLSDGTLRFICLTAILLQPGENQPSTILIDEPELGLHPYAITLLASLLKLTAEKKQIIISTQSADLVSEFDPEHLIVVDLREGESIFSRLEPDALRNWLQEYSLGDLWKKNIFGGRPSR
jgi:predicted ATPase